MKLIYSLLLLLSLTGAYAQEKDCLRLFDNANEAFEVRRQLFNRAESEIVMSYYTLLMDAKPTHLLVLLKQAADRGVKVRVLLDAYTTKLPPMMLKFLQDSNVGVKFYNRTKLTTLHKFDQRLHDKYIVVDRKLLLLGGRNLKDAYFVSSSKKKETFFDMDVLTAGTVATEALEYFDKRWESANVEELEPKRVKTEEYTEYLTELETIRMEFNSTDLPEYNFDLQSCGDTTFYANDPEDKRKDRPLEKIYIDKINQATKSVELVNAYVILTSPLKKAIKAARERGVEVRIITNSMNSSDVQLSYAAYRNQVKKLIKWGVEIFEFAESQTLHAKFGIFDDESVIVGSFNLDPRSARINSENIIVSHDQEAVGQVKVFFLATKELSNRIDSKGIAGDTGSRHPDTTFGKRMLSILFRYTLAPLLRTRL